MLGISINGKRIALLSSAFIFSIPLVWQSARFSLSFLILSLCRFLVLPNGTSSYNIVRLPLGQKKVQRIYLDQ